MILGADGTVLYECSDNLGEDDYNVSLTKDGGAVYEKLESGLTGSAYACVLNNKLEAVAQMEIPYGVIGECYYFLSDGVYYNYYRGRILNVKDNIVIDCQGFLPPDVFSDMDRCVGFYWNTSSVVNPENLDYSGVTDPETLFNLFDANKKAFEFNEVIFNHDFIGCDYDKNYIEGFTIPDFGAKIAGAAISNDGKYVALRLSGADGNCYYTVVNSDGQSLYEPMQAEQLYGSICVCDGYIMDQGGSGITPEGTVFQLGDGTALSGMGENSVAYIENSNLVISDGCIFCNNRLYQLDGTEVTTVTALN